MIDTAGGITHPGILSCLASAGHFSQIVISDGNFPASVRRGPHTEVFYLGWRKGSPTVTEILGVILPLARIQKVTMMQPLDGAASTPVHDEIQQLAGPSLPVQLRDRWAFYELAESATTAGIIVTGDDRRFANVIVEMAPVL
ncbi:RbsD/FucU domain-containing protein [Propionimicrobium sp. PCR01-08-3]|uniref:RbsD/FucU domain-containing protein n=1 Tax=Propionimicrobium sp. PCR01-08-3 TaxID=3052086 RepID=UPI00255CAA71|nr:RbsD/FucU domain-containing protein [Propionimicrobium sp. PCR01-08-3]WIY84027.1 RbsD/FucU domain-containing protein [Propionimicrobium sp. PCR01-08-3]